jgi:hypothetical protein
MSILPNEVCSLTTVAEPTVGMEKPKTTIIKPIHRGRKLIDDMIFILSLRVKEVR